MPMLEPRRLFFRSLLFGLPCLACQEPVAPAAADTEITGASTAPDTLTSPPEPPTTMPGDEGPMTPTTTIATTTTSTTGDAPGTSGGEANTTMVDSWCGDGVVDADEACDDGLAGNDDSRFCKADCTLNVCGDGKLFVGWELCDDGAANSDAYGSLCGEQCEPGARCGDHKLQPEFETCDLGLDNEDPKGDEQGIVCDGTCRALRLRGFVTKDSYTGNLGGLHGADQKCRNAAKAAGLAEPERFKAFLSTKDIAVTTQFENVPASLPYVLVTGTKFADNFAALITTGPLGTGISVTEEGATLYNANVATNTQPGGIPFSPAEHCQSWTSDNGDFLARVGHSGVEVGAPDADAWKAELWWTGFWSWPCDKTFFHLYCLEI